MYIFLNEFVFTNYFYLFVYYCFHCSYCSMFFYLSSLSCTYKYHVQKYEKAIAMGSCEHDRFEDHDFNMNSADFSRLKNFNKERTDRAERLFFHCDVPGIYTYIIYIYVHKMVLCPPLPSGDLEKGIPMFPLHKRNIDSMQIANKSNKFARSVYFSLH